MNPQPNFPFPHTQLDVFRIAIEMAQVAKAVCAQIPRGHRPVADHLMRAAQNTVLLVGEGANRFSAPQKRQRYSEARGEAGEVASAAHLCLALSLAEQSKLNQLLCLCGRTGAMLTKLILRHR